jgi:LIVCS family branched-chain amino acid:cation transporter
MNGVAGADSSRTGLLSQMIALALGPVGGYLLSLLIALACFTTAVGIVTGTADFVKSRFAESERAYRITALAGCALGVAIGQLSVESIIAVALPALMFIYPLTIVLIGLNALPPRFAPSPVFRAVVLATLVFSIPDFLGSLKLWGAWGRDWAHFPLQGQGLGWLLPAAATYGLSRGWHFLRSRGSFSAGGGDIPEK